MHVRLVFDHVVHLVEYSSSALLHFGKAEFFSPSEETQLCFKFMFLGVFLWENVFPRRQWTVITINVVRHVPRASGPFLREMPAKASMVEA